ncbi:hypothetical protein A3C23_04165 [Candidatus Roizmanbacteria bacterium RIFCSPHIGHO2_02_FULL_37_13b]|uniref:Uncharacterized protein n=1 Tax=Candidatus Roizmanbacteria bacterium RIFCSPLOWO2_02_FULL_36_11 TaxID=1802071 RepID=A0A1F7JH17_9BACT|nr:MAG: hypothetical protein A3C23_04165 [Candidatus Roizmanbacteria bacterium RIFCSPHIGHO2_02_FULL_37_13b]OGK54907.1 MAG: hypothetical protein A3H78_00310 [Candidatus Roizmanbacteria bacterium RIFCSPLOWO2_02_FULL_36_11]
MYCSKECRLKARTTRTTLTCDNPLCKISFERLQKEIIKSNAHYCSRTCAISINNKKFPKRKAKIKECIVCNNKFTGEAKCCSIECRKKKIESLIIPGKIIIDLIKVFYKKNGRIPFKKECSHYYAARGRFGTWNKAIEAAGYSSNPVRFAKKHIAKDGHKCDSLSEKIIDDFLYRKKIKHAIHVPYGKCNMTADFKVDDTLLEFTGLVGQLKAYDKLLERKRAFWKEYELKVIEIHPTDLFPVNKLATILAQHV